MCNLFKRKKRLFIISVECINSVESKDLIKKLNTLRPQDDFIITNHRVIEIKEIK